MIPTKKDYIFDAKLPLKVHSDKVSDNEKNGYLLMTTAHKMIKQFLNEKKMSKTELAKKLSLTLEEFEQFNSVYGYKKTARSASYKLLCLYCRTKWQN